MGCIKVNCNRVGNGICAQCSRIGNGMDVSCNRIGNGLIVNASLVCSVNLGSYVRVSKKYLFLTPENNNTDYVDIISNVKWDIY